MGRKTLPTEFSTAVCLVVLSCFFVGTTMRWTHGLQCG